MAILNVSRWERETWAYAVQCCETDRELRALADAMRDGTWYAGAKERGNVKAVLTKLIELRKRCGV